MAQAPYTPKAQEARNKAVVERYFREVLDQKKVELLPELFARDVVLHRPGFDVAGLEAAAQRLRAVLQDYSAFSSELAGLIAEGGRSARDAPAPFRGTARAVRHFRVRVD